jgi:hypothetical protein
MALIPLGILSAAGAGGAAFSSDYELIESYVLTGTQASVTFSNLGDYSSVYKHFQIRGVARTNRNDTLDEVNLRFNGDSSALSTSLRLMSGNGSSVGGGGAEGQNRILMSYVPAANNTANTYAGFVADILDVYSTTKHKSVRALAGQYDSSFSLNTIHSGAWYNTSAISSILLYCNASFVSGTRFSLYGIKG